jgi:RNA polymerase sigma-70 factor (ECF subfamily)
VFLPRRHANGMTDWDAIVERDGPAVWRTVYRLLGRRADAEDCFQETFLAALRLWARQPVQHPRAALQRLATARAVDRLRRRYRESGRTAGVDWDNLRNPGPSPPQQAVASELSQRLRDALALLPGKQADVFCLYCLEGWAYADIATELGISVDAVGVMLHRARARLRAGLAGVEGEVDRAGPGIAHTGVLKGSS